MDKETYLKLLTLDKEQTIGLFNSGMFNDILEAYIKEFLKAEKIQVENIHDKVKVLLDMLDAQQVLEANKNIYQ